MILFETLLPTCHIAEINPSFSHLGNGVGYSFVECRDGTQYGLQAFGNEALELHRAAFQELRKMTLIKK